ncbi:major facilitator superfamily domain-containing protein [Lipomyces starkeyi]
MYEQYGDEKSCINDDLHCDRKTYNSIQIDRLSDDYLPDVGLRPWLVVLGGFCGQFCSIGMINVIGIFIAYYQHNQLADLSPSAISWIGSINHLSSPSLVFSADDSLTCMAQGGSQLADVFLLPLEYYQFVLAQGICASLGAAGLFYGPTAALSGWFCSRRGLAFGIAASGASIGGICLSLIFENVSIYICSFRILARRYLRDLFSTSATRHPALSASEVVYPSFFGPVFSLYTASMFLIYLGLYVPMAYFASSAIAEGIPTAKALQIITYFNVGSFFGRVVLGLLSDKMDKFALFSIINLIAGLVSAPFWYYSHSEATIIIVAVANVFFTGGILAMFTALVAHISPVEEIGTRIGVFSGVIAFAALASLPIAGAIVGTDGNYNGLKIYGGVVLGSVSFKLAKIERSCG